MDNFSDQNFIKKETFKMESEQLREMTTKSHQPSRQSSTLLSSDASTSSIRNDPPQTNTGSILRLDSSIGKVRQNNVKVGQPLTGNVIMSFKSGQRPGPIKIVQSNVIPNSKMSKRTYAMKTMRKTGYCIQLDSKYFSFKSVKNWSMYTYNEHKKKYNSNVKRIFIVKHQDYLGGFIFLDSTIFSSVQLDLPIFLKECQFQLWSNSKLAVATVDFDVALQYNVPSITRFHNVLDYFRMYVQNQKDRHMNCTKWNIESREARQPLMISSRSTNEPGKEVTFKSLIPQLYQLTDFCKLTRCKKNDLWVILTHQECISHVHTFVNRLWKASKSIKLALPKLNIVTVKDLQKKTILTELDQIVRFQNPRIILSVIPSDRQDLYILIKLKLCIYSAVSSLIVTFETLQNISDMRAKEIITRMHLRSGSIPCHIPIYLKGLMIVGLQVYSNSPSERESYGAFVASMNDNHSRFFSRVEQYKTHEDLSDIFANNLLRALNKFKIQKGIFPTSIIIYRDGVSNGDSEICEIQATEVRKIKDVCEKMYGPNRVKLVFIVITSRIARNGQRLFINSNTQNPESRSTVNEASTNPIKYDFILVSQNPQIGSMAPNRYLVIEDTLGLVPGKVQQITYRSTIFIALKWPISFQRGRIVPVPCHLAHKLAILAGRTLKGTPSEELDELLYYF